FDARILLLTNILREFGAACASAAVTRRTTASVQSDDLTTNRSVPSIILFMCGRSFLRATVFREEDVDVSMTLHTCIERQRDGQQCFFEWSTVQSDGQASSGQGAIPQLNFCFVPALEFSDHRGE